MFIDNNPSPLVATFDLAGTPAIVQIDMRVRVDRFTSVRAIAEADWIAPLMRLGELKVVGAYYSIETGEVSILE